MSESLSIIICYYNAGVKLIPTLTHIKNLDISGWEAVELILVNNCSDDNSNELAKNNLKDFNKFTWKIINEATPGLSNARLKAFSESKADFLLFCDDDNWLSPDYITKAIGIFKNDPEIAVLGGKGKPVSEITIPEWFDKYKNFYATGEQMPRSGLVKGSRNVVYGAGMFVRRSAWDYIVSRGFKFYSLGRTGKKLSSGEDSEMCLAFQIAGFKIWYEDSLLFSHYIEPKRLTLSYCKKLDQINSIYFITNYYRRFLFGFVPKVTEWFWLKEFLYSTKDILTGLIKLNNFDEIRWNIYFSVYLLKRRKKYNKDVEEFIKICVSLSQRVSILKGKKIP